VLDHRSFAPRRRRKRPIPILLEKKGGLSSSRLRNIYEHLLTFACAVAESQSHFLRGKEEKSDFGENHGKNTSSSTGTARETSLLRKEKAMMMEGRTSHSVGLIARKGLGCARRASGKERSTYPSSLRGEKRGGSLLISSRFVVAGAKIGKRGKKKKTEEGRKSSYE